MLNYFFDKKAETKLQIAYFGITSDVFGRLYDLHVKPIFRFIYFKVNSQEEAEDLTSETFLRAWDYISKSGKGNEIKNIRAFFYQIAGNLVVDYYRKKDLLPLALDAMVGNGNISDNRISHFDKIIKNEEIRDIKAALKNIPENYCDIVIWYYLEDLKIAEISQIIRKSEGAVRVLIHRALKSLKRELEIIDIERKNSIKNTIN